MGNIDLTTLIVGTVCGVGVIEFIMWIIVVIRHPGYDYLRPDPVPVASTLPEVASISQGARSSGVGK